MPPKSKKIDPKQKTLNDFKPFFKKRVFDPSTFSNVTNNTMSSFSIKKIKIQEQEKDMTVSTVSPEQVPEVRQQLIKMAYGLRVEICETWLHHWRFHNEPVLFLTGPHGCGKSYLIETILQKHEYTSIVYINLGDYGTLPQYETRAKYCKHKKTGGGTAAGFEFHNKLEGLFVQRNFNCNKKEALLIDVSEQSDTCLKVLVEYITFFKKNNPSAIIPIILMAEEISWTFEKTHYPFDLTHSKIHLPALSSDYASIFISVLLNAKQLSSQTSKEAKQQAVEHCQGNISHLLQYMIYFTNNWTKPLPLLTTDQSESFKKDVSLGALNEFSVFQSLFNGDKKWETYCSKIDKLGVDRVMDWFFSNYNNLFKTIEQLNTTSDMLSLIDFNPFLITNHSPDILEIEEMINTCMILHLFCNVNVLYSTKIEPPNHSKPLQKWSSNVSKQRSYLQTLEDPTLSSKPSLKSGWNSRALDFIGFMPSGNTWSLSPPSSKKIEIKQSKKPIIKKQEEKQEQELLPSYNPFDIPLTIYDDEDDHRTVPLMPIITKQQEEQQIKIKPIPFFSNTIK